WAKVLAYISVMAHYESFGKGVLDLKDAVYYATLIFVGLFLTSRSLESLRWRSSMNIELLKARQTKFAGYIAVYVAIIITAVVVVNVLANRYDKSYDGTANKRYSLSDQTKKIVRELNQDATIRYFDQSTRYSQAKDILDQYSNHSPKIHIDYTEPEKSPEIARA